VTAVILRIKGAEFGFVEKFILFCIVEPSLREIWFDRFDIPDSGGREGLPWS
jgi:hypothetical protein